MTKLAGSNQANVANGANINPNRIVCCAFAPMAGKSGTANSIKVYLASSSSNIKPLLYDSGGNLIAEGSVIGNTGAGWQTSTITDTAVTVGDIYYIATHVENYRYHAIEVADASPCIYITDTYSDGSPTTIGTSPIGNFGIPAIYLDGTVTDDCTPEWNSGPARVDSGGSFTPATGTDRLVVYAWNTRPAGGLASAGTPSVTIGGVTATTHYKVNTSYGIACGVSYIKETDIGAGALTITISWSGTPPSPTGQGRAFTLSRANQSSPEAAWTDATTDTGTSITGSSMSPAGSAITIGTICHSSSGVPVYSTGFSKQGEIYSGAYSHAAIKIAASGETFTPSVSGYATQAAVAVWVSFAGEATGGSILVPTILTPKQFTAFGSASQRFT